MRLKPPKFIRWLMPDLIWEMKDRSAVYLTFDDGPTPGITEWILSTLEKYDAKATFFVLGKNAEMYPDLYRRILDAGHRIGNHTYSHQKGWGMSLERYIEDVDFANDLLHTELFRPPYARITPAQARALAKRYKLVMWDVPLARLQPCAVAPHLPAQRYALPRRRVDRRLPRFRKVVPQHELRPAAHASASATWDVNSNGDRPVKDCTRRRGVRAGTAGTGRRVTAERLPSVPVRRNGPPALYLPYER